METSVYSNSYLFQYAQSIGTSEQGLRLLLSLLLGYPMLFIHQLYLRKSRPSLQHMYFIIGGLLLAIFNYGTSFGHSVVCIIATWLNLYLIGGTKLSVIISFLFQMVYLIGGYSYTGTDNYDIKWTMPHCVLTLRLIGLTFDVFDGQKPRDQVSKDQKITALKKSPKLIEIASQAYFPASFLVGPQFSMRRYLDFIHGTLIPANTASPISTGIYRGLIGLFLLVVYQVGSIFFPLNYLISESFMSHSLPIKWVLLGLWGKVFLYKYMSCWLITEGICIMCGLAYSGKDENNKPMWKGCANVQLTVFETGVKFEQLITGFNTNTNNWVSQYVYKRLKFFNNILISQITSLLFLAVWHGMHSGYYACFIWEFFLMYFEKNFSIAINKYPNMISAMERKPMRYLVYIVMKTYCIVVMGYSVAPFALLKSKWYWDFYVSMYFSGHIIFACWFIYAPIAKMALTKINATFFQNSVHESAKKEN